MIAPPSTLTAQRTVKPYSPNFIVRLVHLIEGTVKKNLNLEKLQISNLGQFSLSPAFMQEIQGDERERGYKSGYSEKK